MKGILLIYYRYQILLASDRIDIKYLIKVYTCMCGHTCTFSYLKDTCL